MPKFTLSSLFALLLVAGVAGCGGSAVQSNFSKAVSNAEIGSVFTVRDQTYKKVGPGAAVSCKAPCSEIPVLPGN